MSKASKEEKEPGIGICGRTAQAELSTNTKKLKWVCAWHVQGTARSPVCLERFMCGRVLEDKVGRELWLSLQKEGMPLEDSEEREANP